MSIRIVRHEDPGAFLDRARRWLLEKEAENNLILGIAAALVAGDHDYDPPIYLATVERGTEVVGCAWRTPPFKLGLTTLPEHAVRPLAVDVAEVYDEIGAVLGDEHVAGAFARAWSELRPVEVRPGMRQRIYALTEVTSPPEVEGRLRRAEPTDRDRLVAWWEAFQDEAGVAVGKEAGRAVDRRMEAGVLWVWEDDEVVSMAAAGSRTPNGVRIGPVYTPPERRRRGYATSLVAAVSRRELDEGRKVCFLYTDLSNPTSNSVYVRIGYRPVSDVRDFHFERVRP